MSSAWAAEQQLPLQHPACGCLGSLGCLHDVSRAMGQLSPDQSDFDTRFLEVGGLDLDTVGVRPQGRLLLPPVMPVVDETGTSRGVHRPMVAVLLDQMWRSARDGITLSRSLGLPANVGTLVAPFARDEDLEALWQDRPKFLRALLGLRPSAVIGPSYSTWVGHSWLEQRYAMKRSLEVVRIFQDQGLFAIPHLAWGRRRDAEDLGDWLARNEPAVAAVDAQCVGPIFDAWLAELAWLRDQLHTRPALIVGGIRSGLRLQRIVSVWPESSFIYNGVRLAASHRQLRLRSDGRLTIVRYGRAPMGDLSLGLMPQDSQEPSPDLLYRRSLHEFERSLARCRGRSRLPPNSVLIDGDPGSPANRVRRRDGIVASISAPDRKSVGGRWHVR